MLETTNKNALISSQPKNCNAALILDDGTIFWGRGAGAMGLSSGCTAGEVCFNTSLTGYQEILTDPSYAGQIVTFTFPHIGNVGTNAEDIETLTPAVSGCVLGADITEPANWRSAMSLDAWLTAHGLAAVTGIDTRSLTRRIRSKGFAKGIIVYPAEGTIDIAKFFDQVSRPLVVILARAAGIPEKVLSAYSRYQESLAIYNTIAR